MKIEKDNGEDCPNNIIDCEICKENFRREFEFNRELYQKSDWKTVEEFEAVKEKLIKKFHKKWGIVP